MNMMGMTAIVCSWCFLDCKWLCSIINAGLGTEETEIASVPVPYGMFHTKDVSLACNNSVF